MSNIIVDGNIYESRTEETILATLLRNSADVRFSCGQGVCHTCMMKQTNGTPPEDSQKGLSNNLKEKSYFLPCICLPTEDMEISRPEKSDIFLEAKVIDKTIDGDVCRLYLELDEQFDYHSGQYITLRRLSDQLERCYSLTSTPYLDIHLEIHIKRVKDGQFSNWIFDELNENEKVEIGPTQGDCYYNLTDNNKKMLLIGTSTGAGPLYGIAKDALLLHSHTAEIYFYHGCRHADELYLDQELEELTDSYPNFHYVPCLSTESEPNKYASGRASDIAFTRHNDLTGFEVFVCGLPEMVYATSDEALKLGASKECIHSDAFELSKTEQVSTTPIEKEEHYAHREEKFEFPTPNPKMWEALGNGDLLTEILTDFYNKVYEDDLLSPYFKKIEKDRVIQKQYSFMKQVLTGENIYLGDKPRNAHHWMVISDGIFDYREKLIERSMRKFDLPEIYINSWLVLDESYRERIVKNKPWNKIQDGIVVPVEGYDEVVLDQAGVCDLCFSEIAKGTTVKYHVMEAQMYCSSCTSEKIN